MQTLQRIENDDGINLLSHHQMFTHHFTSCGISELLIEVDAYLKYLQLH